MALSLQNSTQLLGDCTVVPLGHVIQAVQKVGDQLAVEKKENSSYISIEWSRVE
jgi:hypothetical protein